MALGEGDLYASYRRLERPLYNVLYRMLWNRQDCQDIMQDAFLRIWQRREHVDPARLDGLLWTAALNLARNRRRRRRLWRTEPMDAEWPDSGPSPESVVEGLRQQRRLRQALSRLPARMRDVLLLGEFSGMSRAEIAEVLRIPPGTVASRRHHALRKLHVLLRDNLHE